MTLINPIFSEWKSVGLELMISMMYRITLEYKSPLRHLKVMDGGWVGGLGDYRVSSLALLVCLRL